MKIDCGPTPQQRYEARMEYLTNWHRWFAWRPVRLGVHDCRWLEVIERRLLWRRRMGHTWWEPEYRALN